MFDLCMFRISTSAIPELRYVNVCHIKARSLPRRARAEQAHPGGLKCKHGCIMKYVDTLTCWHIEVCISTCCEHIEAIRNHHFTSSLSVWIMQLVPQLPVHSLNKATCGPVYVLSGPGSIPCSKYFISETTWDHMRSRNAWLSQVDPPHLKNIIAEIIMNCAELRCKTS